MVIVGSLAALGLSGVFWAAGAAKLRNLTISRSGFVALGLPRELVPVVVLAELVTGFLLLVAPRVGGVIAALLLLGFTAALSRAKRRTSSVGFAGVRCNCFGSSEEVTSRTFVRNAFLFGLSVLAGSTTKLHVNAPALLAGALLLPAAEVVRQLRRISRTSGSLFPGVPSANGQISTGHGRLPTGSQS